MKMKELGTILVAYRNLGCKRRTLIGLSKQTKLPIETIKEVLDELPQFELVDGCKGKMYEINNEVFDGLCLANESI